MRTEATPIVAAAAAAAAEGLSPDPKSPEVCTGDEDGVGDDFFRMRPTEVEVEGESIGERDSEWWERWRGWLPPFSGEDDIFSSATSTTSGAAAVPSPVDTSTMAVACALAAGADGAAIGVAGGGLGSRTPAARTA